ncbi:MAG TPA: coenzyme F420-0:L-glutamate ligase [Nitrososphaeraceae archaeon]|jgi:coenzyme F420-0:L-glutamate ligase / coenzyme F420-1:gamma-L-glutamate ligase|nr:coenzyme F420-0:L-glutamate ligase [Nitrososphaeraceae archaeon]
MLKIEIIPIYLNVNITAKSKLLNILLESIKNNNQIIKNGDIIVIAQKIISKNEGRSIYLNRVIPSSKSLELGRKINKDPRIVELILQESRKIIRVFDRTIITETFHGFICANAGIDQSNVSKSKNRVLLLPKDPDKSADSIRKEIYEKTRKNVAVLITDTFGRPFRMGQTNVAIGIAGINPLKNYKGKRDMFGKIMKVTEIAIVDEIAGAAELVMGKSQGIPVAIVRNAIYSKHHSSIKKIVREETRDIFR